MDTIFELSIARVTCNRFPYRSIRENTLGKFSTYEKAIEWMQDYVERLRGNYDKEEDEEKSLAKDVFCFYIRERYVNPQTFDWWDDPRKITSFNHRGEYCDEQMWADGNGDLFPFRYREQDKIRFHEGDIVEVSYYKDHTALAIVGLAPIGKAEFEKYKVHWTRLRTEDPIYRIMPFREDTLLDASDDHYIIYTLGEGDTHNHVAPTDIFTPSRPVPEEYRQALQEKFAEMRANYVKSK